MAGWARLAVVALLACSTLLGAEVAVAHASVPAAQLRERELRNALLGRVTVWDGGIPVVLVLSQQDGDRESISTISGRDLGRLLRGWKRLTFSGGGVMPTVVEDRAEAIERVAGTRGAVAILDLPDGAVLPEGVQQVRLANPQ